MRENGDSAVVDDNDDGRAGAGCGKPFWELPPFAKAADETSSSGHVNLSLDRACAAAAAPRTRDTTTATRMPPSLAEEAHHPQRAGPWSPAGNNAGGSNKTDHKVR